MHSLPAPWNHEKLQSTSNPAGVGSHCIIYKILTNKVSGVS
jgi:hypothetical protein